MKTTITLEELDKLIKNSYKVKVKTPSGYENVIDTYEKYSEGKIVKFTDNTEIKAANKHLILKNSSWISVDSLNINDDINGKIVSSIESVKCQKWIDFTVDANHESYIVNGITHHNSGKSHIIYSIVRFYLENIERKILIIVPSLSLITQMNSDFTEYSSRNKWDVESNVHLIYSGQEKQTKKRVIISTWQSIYTQPKEYFEQFECIICDEAHFIKNEGIKAIYESAIDCPYRIGLTGTLDGMKTNKLVIEGLTGKVYNVISTKELMEKDLVSQLQINCILLKHDEDICKAAKDLKYHEELEYLILNNKRNEFVRDLALTLKGNTLILFQFVEKHGEVLYNFIKSKVDEKRKVFYIHGKTEMEIREQSRILTELESDAIIVASIPVYSTGISIRNLHNIILASPTKSRIRLLQSIGRQLRKSKNKNIAKLYDIADDLHWKTHENYTLKHFLERIKIYNTEKFDYNITNIKI